MEFDTVRQTACGIRYGVVEGNGGIVFVKAGLGGDCMGYEQTYLRLAHRLHGRYGCGVICVANPNDGRSHVDVDGAILRDVIARQGLSSPTLFFLGHSNGGVKGLELAASGVCFARMLLINMPLMINLHKLRRHMSMLSPTQVLAVYGERDPSVRYTFCIDGKFDHVRVRTVSGADHNFTGQLHDFLSLADWLMC